VNDLRGYVLIVDDDDAHRELLRDLLVGEASRIEVAEGGRQALERIATDPPDLVLLDVRMPEMSGIDVLRELRASDSVPPAIVITAFAEVDDAVEAMKLGALDYLEKPVDVSALVELVRRHLGSAPTAATESREIPDGLVFESPLMQSLLDEVERVAPTDAPVLLAGESGTGKEVLAELLHCWSSRAQRPLVTVNVAALTESLVESELFGSRKGAYTGADRDRTGLIERANGGTLFLDEVGEMPVPMQPKLLRVLETGRLLPVGDDTERESDFRLVSATNRDLEEEISAGGFRLDLYYRIAVVTIEVPPLRERPEDLLPLARSVLSSTAPGPKQISPAAESLLLAHSWPGNVRELRNAMQRAAILAPGERILPEHLPPSLLKGEPAAGGTLEEIEWRAIREALERCDGNRTQAAKELGISRRKLLYRLKDYRTRGESV
jgi:DNA-binding NtrC family response regulator